ncbi:hypothetical protein GCK72_025050 [Caenorhabditis remanei]|uniref:Uncharacterized protein n=1 Tax=Caenorhabditis remanei TaxID=31234 RepID=A0A6A5G1B3_CAERE|nr:hypothetical protein GCK72_025050 [Caenorhabditis remanei]KAF1748583.1 hypothetical protein GCK72_025050 [Caenorhabditis remanei]
MTFKEIIDSLIGNRNRRQEDAPERLRSVPAEASLTRYLERNTFDVDKVELFSESKSNMLEYRDVNHNGMLGETVSIPKETSPPPSMFAAVTPAMASNHVSLARATSSPPCASLGQLISVASATSPPPAHVSVARATAPPPNPLYRRLERLPGIDDGFHQEPLPPLWETRDSNGQPIQFDFDEYSGVPLQELISRSINKRL